MQQAHERADNNNNNKKKRRSSSKVPGFKEDDVVEEEDDGDEGDEGEAADDVDFERDGHEGELVIRFGEGIVVVVHEEVRKLEEGEVGKGGILRNAEIVAVVPISDFHGSRFFIDEDAVGSHDAGDFLG